MNFETSSSHWFFNDAFTTKIPRSFGSFFLSSRNVPRPIGVFNLLSTSFLSCLLRHYTQFSVHFCARSKNAFHCHAGRPLGGLSHLYALPLTIRYTDILCVTIQYLSIDRAFGSGRLSIFSIDVTPSPLNSILIIQSLWQD